MVRKSFGKNFSGKGKKEMPLKVGDKYNIKVERLTVRGDGFVRIKGVAVFVKNVSIGWEGEVMITKLGPTYAIANPA